VTLALNLQEKQKARDGRKRAYAHSGIKSAANAVLMDLETNGILPTLLQPDHVRKKSAEYRNLRSGSGRNVDVESSQSSQASGLPSPHPPPLTPSAGVPPERRHEEKVDCCWSQLIHVWSG